jgi:hypothetical protein
MPHTIRCIQARHSVGRKCVIVIDKYMFVQVLLLYVCMRVNRDLITKFVLTLVIDVFYFANNIHIMDSCINTTFIFRAKSYVLKAWNKTIKAIPC